MNLSYPLAGPEADQQPGQKCDTPGQILHQHVFVQRVGPITLRPETI
jgi:hypothetical protein